MNEQHTPCVIIAGTRSFGSGIDTSRVISYVESVVEESGFDVGEVVSGTARGADTAGEQWATVNDIPIERFPADWDEHGKAAGHIRNNEMAEYGDKLVALWDGKSPGTRNMIETARDELGDEHVHVHKYRE